jgi:hypothetical protein
VPWDIGAYQWVLTGVTYYVATTGDDSHAGTIGSPFLTIQHCLGIMASGDTCIARGGHYSGFAVGYSYTTTGTSWDIPNTFMGYPGETVTIDCSPLTDNAILFNGIPGGTTLMYWILKDFVVDGTNGLLSSGADGSALIDGGGWYVRIQNVELSYPPRVGISNGANSNYWELLNLNVHHARTLAANDTGHGAYMKGDYLLVDGGIWHDNTGYGLQIYNGGTPVSYAVVRNARIYNNYTGHLRTIQHGGGGMVMGSGAGDVAYNDLIYDNFGNGLDIDYRCGLFDSNFMTVPCEVYNNSIYGNEQSAITLGKDDPPMCNPFSTPAGGPCTMATVKNNICYGNTNGCITDIQSISTQANNLTSNPSYTNAGSSDFTLTSGSVARGYGLNLTSLAISGLLTDFADVARPAVAAWDAGAYQFAATMSLSIIPSTGTKGDSVAIVMTGVSTNWVNGTSTCSFNSATNITVISTVVASATSATCNIAISSSAASTARDIIMTTDTEVVTLTNGFTVLNIPSLVGGKVRGRFH